MGPLILDLLHPPALILLAWVILGGLFVGYGLVVQRLAGTRIVDGQRLLAAFWQGYVVVLLLLQLWHLALPAGGGTALLTLAVGGGSGILWHAQPLWGYLRAQLPRRWRVACVLAVLGVWVAHRAAGPCTLFDTGLYHMNAVKWDASYPLVPGLGNLHGRLACNNAGFLVAAMMECGPWVGRSQHVVNGLLVAGLLAVGLVGSVRLWTAGRDLRVARVFPALLVLPALAICLDPARDISSHSTDLPAWVLGLVAATYLLRLLDERDLRRDPARDPALLLLVTSLLAAATCVKLSAAGFSAAAWGLAVIAWLRTGRGTGRGKDGHGRSRNAGQLLLTCGLSVAVIGPWLVRGVVLSGYPLYPASLGRFDLDWSMPAERVLSDRAWIRSWALARVGPDQIDGWDWLGSWLGRMSGEFELVLVPAILAAIGLSISICFAGRGRWGGVGFRRAAWVAVPLSVGLAVWFASAPDPRFALPQLYLLGLLPLSAAIALLLARRPRGARVAAVICTGLAFVPLVERAAQKTARGTSVARAVAFTLVRPPGPEHGFYPLPKAEFCERTTQSGLRVHLPCTPGPDGKEDGRAWDGPLVSTPYFNPELSLRRPPELRWGFRVAGTLVAPRKSR